MESATSKWGRVTGHEEDSKNGNANPSHDAFEGIIRSIHHAIKDSIGPTWYAKGDLVAAGISEADAEFFSRLNPFAAQAILEETSGAHAALEALAGGPEEARRLHDIAEAKLRSSSDRTERVH